MPEGGHQSVRPHRLTGAPLLKALVCALVGFSFSPLRAQDASMDTIKDQLVGNWTLVSVTTHVGTRSSSPGQSVPTPVMIRDVQPYGSNPKGRLVFGRNGRFASTVTNSNGSNPAAKDPDAPVEFEASSGTYSMHPSRPKTVIFDIEPRGQRYVEIKTLTANALEFSTMAWPGGVTHSSFVYRRAE
jgi:Lipocalin-like domain